MENQKKTIKITEEEKEDLFERLTHVGSRFEFRLAEKLPISYQYTKPGEVPSFKNKLIVDATEYEATSSDLANVPDGSSKYHYYDRCRELVQSNIIDKIKHDQGDMNTFLLYVRPRIEAITTGIFRIRLEGIWVKDKQVPQIDGPEEFEEPFPNE